MVDFKYRFNQDLIEQVQIDYDDYNDRNPDLFARDIGWATDSYKNLFGY